MTVDGEFTHVDQAGNARMVDVSGKAVTHRTAVAQGPFPIKEFLHPGIKGPAGASPW